MSRNYTHKIDKNKITTCNILGVNIAAINMEWLLDFTVKYVKDLSGDYMCVSNVHTTITSYENEHYRAVQNGGIMAIPDGGPLALVGQRRGYKNMNRIAGPSYLEEILKISVLNGWKHYLYGSTEETLKKLKVILEGKYPGLQIVGMYSPPFRPISDEEDKEIVSKINQAGK